MKYETWQKINSAIENWANANFPKLFPEDEDYKRILKTRNDPENQLRRNILGAMLSDRDFSRVLAEIVAGTAKEDFNELVEAVVERFFDLIEAAIDA